MRSDEGGWVNKDTRTPYSYATRPPLLRSACLLLPAPLVEVFICYSITTCEKAFVELQADAPWRCSCMPNSRASLALVLAWDGVTSKNLLYAKPRIRVSDPCSRTMRGGTCSGMGNAGVVAVGALLACIALTHAAIPITTE